MARDIKLTLLPTSPCIANAEGNRGGTRNEIEAAAAVLRARKGARSINRALFVLATAFQRLLIAGVVVGLWL